MFKVNESRYKQCGETSHFSAGQNLFEKKMRKDKHLFNQLKKAF